MKIPLWQVDAFASRPFTGNPAAVCPLEAWLADDVMQAIAAENNLSETAFFVPRSGGDFDLRWFTPAVEVELCGHATLASAWVVLHEMAPGRERVVFHTKSGPLTVTRDGDRLRMDLPARPPRPAEASPELAAALGRAPVTTLRARDPLAVFERAEDVRALAPDMAALAALKTGTGVIVTAPGTGADADVDFVSRFFAPAKGIPEDPVTGGAHTTLVPYWAGRLGKPVLRARQVSARGGELACMLEGGARDGVEAGGGRVVLGGRAVVVLRGTMEV